MNEHLNELPNKRKIYIIVGWQCSEYRRLTASFFDDWHNHSSNKSSSHRMNDIIVGWQYSNFEDCYHHSSNEISSHCINNIIVKWYYNRVLLIVLQCSHHSSNKSIFYWIKKMTISQFMKIVLNILLTKGVLIELTMLLLILYKMLCSRK